MQIIPLHTSTLNNGDDLAGALAGAGHIQKGDIFVVSSKAIATVEGAAIDLGKIAPSKEAIKWSAKTGRSPAFMEAVLQEIRRLDGKIMSTCPEALLTEVRPKGLAKGTILIANAGLDESNVEKNFTIGWPRNPVASAMALRRALEEKSAINPLAVIITDSCCIPRRWGVLAFALATSGIDPLQSQVGREDLFGKPLRITTEAVADQLATAANFLMGNAGQSIPAAIIRDHGLTLSSFEGLVPGIEPEEDLFRGMIKE